MGIVVMVAHTAPCTTPAAINSHNIHLLPIRSACMMTKDYLLFWMCLVTPSLNLQFMHVCDDVKLCVPNARRISSRAWSPPVPSDTSLSSKRKQVPSWCLRCRFFIYGDRLSSMQASARWIIECVLVALTRKIPGVLRLRCTEQLMHWSPRLRCPDFDASSWAMPQLHSS